MSDQMPTGWMDAETARRWARRGVWAYRDAAGRIGSVVAYADGDIARSIWFSDWWRYISAYPDDLDAPAPAPAEAGETMQHEAWASVWVGETGPRAAVWHDEDDARGHAVHESGIGHPAHVVRVPLTLPVPKPAPVLTVTATGEVCDG